MSDTFTFKIDGVDIEAKPGQTILDAADAAGIYIPRLCAMEELSSSGHCRVCTVLVNGRPQAACTQPAAPNIHVENDTPELAEMRRDIIDLLFVEGNHFCMVCEKSGNCELQALAYRFGITAPKFPFQFPSDRQVDASHPDIFIDHNRCILCGRCVSASRDIDGKSVFEFTGRGAQRKISLNSDKLADTDITVTDTAMECCPVGAILKKRVGYAVPVGQRTYDHTPIGSDIEQARNGNT